MITNGKTKNRSFLEMYELTGDKSILQIYDDELQGKDNIIENIFSDNMDTDPEERSKIINKITKECKKNVWYFFREMAKVPPAFHSESPLQYHLTKESYILIKCYIAKRSAFVMKNHILPAGLTTTWLLLSLYDACFHHRSSHSKYSKFIHLLTDSYIGDSFTRQNMTNVSIDAEYIKEREVIHRFRDIFLTNEIFFLLSNDLMEEKIFYDKIQLCSTQIEKDLEYVKKLRCPECFVDITSYYIMQNFPENYQLLLSNYIGNPDNILLGISEFPERGLTTGDDIKDQIIFERFELISSDIPVDNKRYDKFLKELQNPSGKILIIS